jgi:hypothetical protein
MLDQFVTQSESSPQSPHFPGAFNVIKGEVGRTIQTRWGYASTSHHPSFTLHVEISALEIFTLKHVRIKTKNPAKKKKKKKMIELEIYPSSIS